MAHLTKDEIVTIRVLHERGESRRATARRLGVDEKTIRYHLGRGADARDGRAKTSLIERQGLQAAVAQWWLSQQEALPAERSPNVEALRDHLRSEHGFTGSVKSVRKYVQRHLPRPKLRPYRRVETPPGAQAQVDWSDHEVDIGEGGMTRLHAFHLKLSHSRREAIVWCRRMDQVSWHHAHNRALVRVGGVPAVLRIDNLKTGIGHGAGPWGRINAQYAAYAHALGFHVDACLPRSPEHKGKVERNVRTLRGWGLAERQFDSLEVLQTWTDERVEREMRRRVCPPTGTTIAEAWEVERRLLRPLPETLPEPFDTVVTRVVGRDCRVAFEGRSYPVPFAHVGLPVEVRGCAGVVQIVDPLTGQVLRAHARGTAARLIQDPTCYAGEATDRVLPPLPLGAMARKLDELAHDGVPRRSIELYAALAEVAR